MSSTRPFSGSRRCVLLAVGLASAWALAPARRLRPRASATRPRARLDGGVDDGASSAAASSAAAARAAVDGRAWAANVLKQNKKAAGLREVRSKLAAVAARTGRAFESATLGAVAAAPPPPAPRRNTRAAPSAPAVAAMAGSKGWNWTAATRPAWPPSAPRGLDPNARAVGTVGAPSASAARASAPRDARSCTRQ